MIKRKAEAIKYQDCDDEVFNGISHKKLIMRNRGLKLILLFLIALSIYLGFFAPKRIFKVDDRIIDPELARAMTYEQVQPGDAATNSECVTFDAFFLRDLDGDGYAEGVRGTCREIGKTDTLYMELNVIKDGYLKDGKITINGKNFYLSTTIPKDDQIAENAISSNTTQILFNDISDGTQKLLSGAIRAGDNSRAQAIGKNTNDYSCVNSIVLTGTHVASDGTETPIEKIVNFNLDWYGTAKASIPYYAYSSTKNLAQTKEIRESIDTENNEITLEFDIYTAELENKLNLKKSVLYGTIPQLGDSDPINVEITGTNVTYTYDPATKEYIAQIEAKTDENGVIVQNAYTDSYYNSRYGKFHVAVTYPLEAFYEMTTTSFEYRLPVNAYFEAFNNDNEEFDNPYITNTVSNVAVVEFKQILQEGTQADFSLEIGNYLSSPSGRRVVHKLKPLKIYNGISESEDDDFYPVKWNAYMGTEQQYDKLILKEGIENEEKVFDKIIDVSGNYVSMKDFTKYVSIGFSNPVTMLGEDGWIKVYDDETDELLVTFDKTNWDRYSSASQYVYDIPVRSIRVETSSTNFNSNLSIYHTKEIDDEYIVENYSKEEFDGFRYVRTRLEAYTEDELFRTLTATANYEAPLSVARLSISKSAITTQATENNEIITIRTECSNSSNEAYWKNGMFLIKLPSEIIDASINSISIDNENVLIKNYEVYEENGNYYIKIITTNDEPSTYKITIDMKITPDPRISTVSKSVEMYARNEENENYYYYGKDVCDIDGNGNTTELVNKYSTNLMFVSPSALLTNQTAYDYDKNGSVIIAPQIAYVEKEQRQAKINIQIKNNYASTISDVVILGKIPFEGNTYTIAKGDMGSAYTTSMVVDGIHVPDEIKDDCEVYYSYLESPTKDLDNETNGWTKTPEDFSQVKSYIIVLKNYRMARDEVKDFWYTVNLPEGIDYNEVSYSHYGVYFSLDTENGKYRTQTEPNKLGLMIARQYDLELTKFQKDKTKTVQGASYSICEDGQEDATTKYTNSDGVLVFKNILLDRVYTIREVVSPDEYELSDEVFKFIAHEEDGNIVLEKLEGNSKYFEVVKEEGQDAKVVVGFEDEVKANLKITKLELGSDTKLRNGRYKLTGKNYEAGRVIITNENGEAVLNGLSLGEEYTLEEIKAPKGYYLNNEVIKFTVVNEDGNFVVNKISGVTKSENITTDNEIPTVEFEIEDEKIPTYDLLINKVVKGETTPLAGVKFRLYYGKELWGTYESDENGQILLSGLYKYVEEKVVEQNFTLKEIYTPEGFAKVKDITFSAKDVDGVLTLSTESEAVKDQVADGNRITITVEDPKSFKLTKVDGETAEVLPGTKFAIYNVEDGKPTVAYDAKGNIVGTPMTIDGKEYYIVETDERGEISANLGEGLYKAVEIEVCDEKYDISKVSDHTYYFGIGASRDGGSSEDEGLIKYIVKNTSRTNESKLLGLDDGSYVHLDYNAYAITKFTEDGTLEWKKNDIRATAFSKAINGNILVGTSNGTIYEYSLDGVIVENNKVCSNIINSIDQTENGDYVIGTSSYLIKFDKSFREEWKVSGNYTYVFESKDKYIIGYSAGCIKAYTADGMLIYTSICKNYSSLNYKFGGVAESVDGNIAWGAGTDSSKLTIINCHGELIHQISYSNNWGFEDVYASRNGGFLCSGWSNRSIYRY